jgi:membrane protein YdbS with pleckstrin-like domain
MYKSFRDACERLLKIPHDPTAPPGDQNSTRVFRAATNYYKYLLALWGIKVGVKLFFLASLLIIPVIVISMGHSRDGINLLLPFLMVPLTLAIILGFLSVFSLAVLRLDYEKRWYIVTDRSLRIREGVVAVREMTVNFANIQNLSISQGPLQRILGIADLRVDTAGGGGGVSTHHQKVENLHTAWFRGIDNADEVRSVIQDRLRRFKDSGLGDHEEQSLPAAGVGIGIGPEFSGAFKAALRQMHAEVVALRLAAAEQNSSTS